MWTVRSNCVGTWAQIQVSKPWEAEHNAKLDPLQLQELACRLFGRLAVRQVWGEDREQWEEPACLLHLSKDACLASSTSLQWPRTETSISKEWSWSTSQKPLRQRNFFHQNQLKKEKEGWCWQGSQVGSSRYLQPDESSKPTRLRRPGRPPWS